MVGVRWLPHALVSRPEGALLEGDEQCADGDSELSARQPVHLMGSYRAFLVPLVGLRRGWRCYRAVRGDGAGQPMG